MAYAIAKLCVRVPTTAPRHPRPPIPFVQARRQRSAHQQVIVPAFRRHAPAPQAAGAGQHLIGADGELMRVELRQFTAESAASIVSSSLALTCRRALLTTWRTGDWKDDPAAFRADMAVIHDAAAALIDAIAPALAAGTPLGFAARRRTAPCTVRRPINPRELATMTTTTCKLAAEHYRIVATLCAREAWAITGVLAPRPC